MSAQTAAEKLKEKARRLNAAKGPAGSTPEQPAVDQAPAAEPRLSRASAVQVKPVRSTVDLSPVQHAGLKAWCGETAVEIGTSRVTTQDVMRVLVARLLTDDDLAEKIRADLRVEKQR